MKFGDYIEDRLLGAFVITDMRTPRRGEYYLVPDFHGSVVALASDKNGQAVGNRKPYPILTPTMPARRA